MQLIWKFLTFSTKQKILPLRTPLFFPSLVESASWDYVSQNAWAGVCQTGKKQSPIDIVPKDTEKTDFDPLMWKNNATELGTGRYMYAVCMFYA